MSSESNYSFTTKVNGDLLTVRGDSYDEFHNNLAVLVSNLQPLTTDIGMLQAAGHAVPVVNTAAPAAPSTPASARDDWDTPAPAFAQAQVPSCMHGPRTGRAAAYKSGPRMGQPYRAWFCPSPKGTPNQCSPIFLNPGTPEWDAFPA